MKKFGIAVLLSILVISGCTSTPKKKKQSSSDTPTTQSSVDPGTSSVSPTSQSTTVISSAPAPTTASSSGSTAPISSSSISSVDPVIDLGKQKISFIKNYIAEHPIDVPSGMRGAVDYTTKVTFDGLALQSIDLGKETSKYGLNFSSKYKVIFGDETGYIGAASSTLYNKVGDYDGDPDSKYTITGYLSIYMGNPEIFVSEYTYNKSLSVTFDAKASSKSEMSFSDFFETTKDMEYNCAGHGYGEMYTFSNVTSYLWVSDNTHQKFAWITDGSAIIKTIAHNRPNISKDSVFNIVGLLSMKDYAPALWVIDVEKVESATPKTLDVSLANELSITNLKKNKASQEDTDARFPDYTMSWSKLYKTTGYLTTVEEGGKYYIGMRDEYYSGSEYINGKNNARANYGIALIYNEKFWNINYEYILTGPYGDLVDADESVEVFYILQRLEYTDGKTCWNILLLPSTFPTV